MIDRRLFVRTASAATVLAVAGLPGLTLAQAATGRRFVFVIQRGAADGLATLAPIGDPAFAAARGAFAEDVANATRLDGFFALHPALAETARLFAAREALFVHAVASPYRERSHFDGQNVLETGGAAAYARSDGWLNRLLGMLPGEHAGALALSATVPTILRGAHAVSSYAPSRLPTASDDLMTRVGALYESDPQLHALWQSAVETRASAGDMAGGNGQDGAVMGELAARLLTGEAAARIAVIETGGWDTHANQRGRLAAQLRGLDRMLAALKSGLGPAWTETLVIVATEFGRTVAANGTGGTDHGTASVAMLAGGAVAGGTVLADWPGLAPGALHEGRDLRPTAALDALIAGAVSQHYGLEPVEVMRLLFPDSRGAPLTRRLVSA